MLEPEIVYLQKSFFYAPGQSNITACVTQSLQKSLVLMLLSLSADLMSPSDRMFWQELFSREVHWWGHSLCLHFLYTVSLNLKSTVRWNCGHC